MKETTIHESKAVQDESEEREDEGSEMEDVNVKGRSTSRLVHIRLSWVTKVLWHTFTDSLIDVECFFNFPY